MNGKYIQTKFDKRILKELEDFKTSVQYQIERLKERILDESSRTFEEVAFVEGSQEPSDIQNDLII